MAKLLTKPKILAVVIVLLALFFVGLYGGPLGASFGGGFLKSPIAHVQLPAEALTSPLLTIPVIGKWAITNSMLATWVTLILLIAVAFFATRKMSMVPKGLQNAMEAIIEAFLNLVESIAGPEKARRFFPLVFTIFIFIVTANWLGILPGFGTIGRIETAHHVIEKGKEEGKDLSKVSLQQFNGGSVAVIPFGSTAVTAEEYEHDGAKDADKAGILVPFLRSMNTDLNTPLAIALVAMFMIQVWGMKANGFLGYASKFFNVSKLRKGNPMGLIDIYVGILEFISEIARLISFTFRLFGNIFAGEVLLAAMSFLIPLSSAIAIFFGLELFVGVIQAFIFAMLTLVFSVVATSAHGGEEHQQKPLAHAAEQHAARRVTQNH